MRPLLLAAALLAPLLAAAQGAPISFSPEPVVRGQAVTVRFAEPADTVRFTYRPNSDLASTEAVAIGGATEVQWTPREAGLVAVSTPAATRSVGVRFTRLPVLGLTVLILAGLVLFGGATLSLRALLSGPPSAAADVEHWPDT